ncbi:MAG: hypothetical protein A3G74_00825, partial [Sulfurimonas sp. RIFCSPLOWO2_12_FULL_34_6]
MKKLLILAVALPSLLFAKSEMDTCMKCHPSIVEEFKGSMHKNSSFYDDEIHKAVWEKHPLHEKGDYKCSKCHAPSSQNEDSVKEGISCSTCHTIKSVEQHAKSNSNVYEKDSKTFYSAEEGRESEKVVYKQKTSMFGMNKTTVGSPYHDIDYTNENFYTAEVCMGCHSHKQNSHEFTICETDKEGAKDKKQNCITCHMPKVLGSATTIRQSEKHAFHGFAGARKHPEMLSQYVEIELEKKADGFNVIVENKASHNLLTHPLRVVELRVNLIRDGKTTALKTEKFMKIIGRDKEPSMPWIANEVLVDSMIKKQEKRSVGYDNLLTSGDKIEVQLGYYVVNPKALKKLSLEGNEEAEKFTTLKYKYFT